MLSKQQYLLRISPQYGEHGILAAEIVSLVWPQLILTGFTSWQHYCMALQYLGVSQTLRR